ncbi:MAG: nucleotidyltransferase [Acidobacteria bacterium]|nr:nucleotidyltransferase [Acidobacteriota bacterium]
METSNDLIILFIRLCSELNATKIPYCVAGGFAVGMWGPPRGTSDIDIVIMLNENDRKFMTNFLNNHFKLVQSHDHDMIFRTIHIWRHILKGENENSIFPLDMILCNNDYLKKVIERKIEIVYKNVSIPVISLEDLVILKCISRRDIDKFDIENIINSGNPIDWVYMKEMILQLNLDWDYIETLAS